MLKTIIKSVAVTAGIAVTLSTGAFAQTHKFDTTYAKVPFRVNVDATITAVHGEDTVSKAVTGKTTDADTLKIPLEIKITNAVRHTSGTQGKQNAPIVSTSRGNITLRLPAQSYSSSEIALHSVNGKRILRVKANASESVSGVSRRNVAAGVYLLSVKGVNSNTFTTRLTHNGGNMNINVAFGAENALRSTERQLGKQADVGEGDWEITVSATVTGGYKDSTYTLNLAVGDEYPLQDITLIIPRVYETFEDERDGTTYKKVTIGTQTWMAENLNYNASESVCYWYSADSCAKYGRLYNWNPAMAACPAGWHLPSDAEWTTLMDFVGGASTAGTKLKSSKGWESFKDVPAGTNEYGFSALPGGIGYDDGSFHNAGITGYWWSATEYDANFANMWYMGNNLVNVGWMNIGFKAFRSSVRCVED